LNPELPLVLQHVNAGHPLWAYQPVDGEVLEPGHHFLIKVAEDLEGVPVPLLARLYNQTHPGMRVDTFKPGTIIKHCLPSLIQLAGSTKSVLPATAVAPASEEPASSLSTAQEQGESTVTETKAAAVPAETAPKVTAPKAAPKAGEKKISSRIPEKFAGKTIVPKVSENPRRDGTRGFQSFEVILNGHKASSHHGISYEKYVDGGGRAQDLAWDLEKGNAEIR